MQQWLFIVLILAKADSPHILHPLAKAKIILRLSKDAC
jgi:hypothetical protein